MADDPEAERMPWDADDPAEKVRLAVGAVAKRLGGYGLGMPGQLSATEASEALDAASSFLGTIAAHLKDEWDGEVASEEEVTAELLSPSIRQAFENGCAPASPYGLACAVMEYRTAHIALPQQGELAIAAWNDSAAGVAPSPGIVRADISKIIKAAEALQKTMASVSGDALGRVCLARFEADGTRGFDETIADQLGELIGYAQAALEANGDIASPGRTVSPKTRLALCLGDFLASSGVPVVVDGKPSTQWALAYDLALEANGDGPCPHARKTLQNAIVLRRKERMPPAA